MSSLRIVLAPSAYDPNVGGIEELTRQLASKLAERSNNPYSVVWRPYSMSARYWLQAVPTTTSRALHPQTDLKTASGGTGTRNGRHE